MLCNQSIMVENLKNKEKQRELLTEEMVEILTTPIELAQYKNAIMTAMQKGTKRNIENEPSSKNSQVG